jgi:oxazoline/thiazoline synthase
MIDFEQVPLLAPSQTFQRLADDRSVLFGDDGHVVFEGRDLVEVALLVDGRRTKAELLEIASRRLGDLPALAAFHQLEESGRLVAAAPHADLETNSFWHALGAELPSAAEALREARFRVGAIGSPDPVALAELRQALRDAGLELLPETSIVQSAAPEAVPGSRATLELRLVGDYLHSELDELNRRQLDAGTPWCLVNPFGAVGWLGPIFRPGTGPCWACLAQRLRSNRPVHEYVRRLERSPETSSPAPASLSLSRRLLLNFASLVLARGLAIPDKNELHEQLLTFDFKTLEIRRHFVARRPQCPVCGDPSALRARAERPIELAATPKAKPHQGGYRQFSASDALERHGRLVSPHVGAVSFLEPMPGRSQLWPVYVSGYAVLPQDDAALGTCVRVCAGKGRSHEQARMSALSEAIERRSGEYDGDELRVRASLAELGEHALAPALLHGFSERQYAERARSNAGAKDRSQRVPEPLDPITPIDWTPAWSLSSRVRRCVPFSYCFAGAPPEAGTAYCPANGNGVASGSSLEEAILQGLLELVERDAVAIWWYNALARPCFDLSRMRDQYVEALVAQYRMQGADVWTLNLTHDLGIPVCAAVRHSDRDGFSLGFGCHLDPDLAIQRALSELNQLGDGRNPGTGKPLLDTAAIQDRRLLLPAPTPTSGVREPAPFDGPHLAADIEECLARLRARGLEVFVVDKSRPDFELCVAQVIVPGLRHFWPRLAPGRLYDVPVELGWLTRANDESKLNPVPLLL